MFFFDTYALIEIALENPKFSRYAEFHLIVSPLNVAEFYAFLLRAYGKQVARDKIGKISFKPVQLENELIIQATEFKFENNKKEVSWADCFGYILAKRMGLKFLTGDSQFKDLLNVEFVK